MTTQEIAEHLDLPKKIVGSCIANTRYLHPGKILRVVRRLPITGQWGRDVAVYAAEPGPDADCKVNPAKRRKQVQTRYREKHKALISARSLKKIRSPINPFMGLVARENRSALARYSRITG